MSASSANSSPATSPGGMSTPIMVDDGDVYGSGSTRDGAFPVEAPQQHQQPIAIVGMACRFPGGANSPAEFWELCSRARSGFMSGVPKERFRHEAYYHANPGKTGAYHAQGGYFLNEDPALFDAPFFSLTEKEAIAMDPLHRLLLECTFEALENAGIPKQSAVGRDVGVFIGGSPSEYDTHLSRDSDSMPMFQASGCDPAMQSNRISHFFDFRGPSFTLETACSSSLVAIHAACQSIRNGESELAVSGGCHLNMLPDAFISFSTGRLLSDSGRSIAFDERGTGFGRGEGCGLLILKPLHKAIADKDAIRAVIRGSGTNQDGKTAGITMPNGDAQERLINQVYKNAGLDPKDCGFVEAHGTGTKIGDPTEAGAIYRALGQGRSSNDPLYIGSVKSNIGHLESASGVAAVIKAALSLERGFILPNHDFKKPNTKIPWKDWNLSVPKAQRPWPKGKKYISVNNFGFGGSNAHVVLERAPFASKKPGMSRKPTGMGDADSAQTHKRLFLLSGHDKQSLEAVMANLVVYLEQRPEVFQADLLDNLSYTLARRSLLKWRVAIPAAVSFELIEALNRNSTLPTRASVMGKAGHQEDIRLGFVFTGQGAQWHAMGRELYGPRGFQVYTASLDRADRHLRRLGAQWSLVDELHKDAETSKVSDAHISQPACTAVQLCLVDLVRSWGIRPAAVTGHSSGEIAAAYAAGFLTFKAAVAIAYHRGRMIPILRSSFPRLEGTMMAVGGAKEDVQALIDGVNSSSGLQEQGAQIRIACYNSASSLTISGDTAGIAQLESVIRERAPDTFNRRLQVDVAYHSHHMNLIAKEYQESLASLDPPKSSVDGPTFYSSLHGRVMDGVECDAAYWVDNLTRPVRFHEALTSMVRPASENDEAVSMLVELGPHSALQGPIKQILQAAGVGKDVTYCSALVRKQSAVESALGLVSSVVTRGGLVNVDAINAPSGVTNKHAFLLTDLPRYPWNHPKRQWHDSRMSTKHQERGSGGPRHDLIGIEAIYSTSLEPAWRNVFSLDDLPWLRQHRIQGLTVFPLAAFVTMAVEAASQRARSRAQLSRQGTADFNAVELMDVDVLTPLAFPADVVEGNGSIELSISLRARHDPALAETWDEFHICSWSSGKEWTEHCSGLVMARSHGGAMTARHGRFIAEVTAATEKADAVAMRAAETSTMYAELSARLGVEYGSSFQAMQECDVAEHCVAAKLTTSVGAEYALQGSSALHPAVLESIIDLYWPILRHRNAMDADDTVYLPSSIRHLCIMTKEASAAPPVAANTKAYCAARFGKSQPRPTSVNILATATSEGPADSELVVAVEGLTVSPILGADNSLPSEDPHKPREICYRMEWEPLEPDDPPDDGEPSSRPLPNTDFVVVYSKTGSLSFLLASQLAVTLQSKTAKLPEQEEGLFNRASAKSLEAMETLLSGKTCIVLTEVDDAFLSDLDENQFETFKALAITADKILWVTRGAYLDATLPISNMISGLSRTIRSETLKPFAHLDLQDASDLSRESEKITEAILEVLGTAFGSDKTGDMEFVYTSENLLVPRVVNDHHMDLAVQRITNPLALETQPYGRATADGRALRMQFEAAYVPLKGLSGPATVQEVIFVEDRDVPATELGADEIEFEVKAVGVTTYDAVVAPAASAAMGLEAAGVVTRIGRAVTDPLFAVGSRIACLTAAMKRVDAAGAYASRARTTRSTAFPLGTADAASSPAISFEEAAVLPLAYCTAYHALVSQARLEKGQRVLITSPAAPVAQAALRLSLAMGAAVFLLVDSPEEKTKMMQRYAGAVPENQVLASYGSSGYSHWGGRETYEALKGATSGHGFDLVLDSQHSSAEGSYREKLLGASLAPFGCQVQVHQPSVSAHHGGGGAGASSHKLQAVQASSPVDGLSTPTNASFITVDMVALGRERPQVLDRVFARVAVLFQEGKLAALDDVAVLPFSRAHEALNSLHAADKAPHKTVLRQQPDDMVLAPQVQALSPPPILRADATYLIVGGTGGLGRSMAAWMVANGARHVVLLSRSGKVTAAAQAALDAAAAAAGGARVWVRACDIADHASIAALVEWAGHEPCLPPIRGVVHSAMVLHDVLLEKMQYAEYRDVIASKVAGAWNLHLALDGNESASPLLHPRLDFFVAFSSVSAVIGSRGQAAYAAANTYLDALIKYRQQRGLPAVSLALAAVSDAGYFADPEQGAARTAEVMRNLSGDASNVICEAEVLALLRAAIVGDTASCGHHVITGVSLKNHRRTSQSFWAADAKFRRILGEHDADEAVDGAEGGSGDAVLRPGLSRAEAEDIVCRGLVAKIAAVLMLEPDELDVTRSLNHYHMDSLVAIEVRNFIGRQYEASLQVLELLSSGSIQTLSAIVCKKSKLCQAS